MEPSFDLHGYEPPISLWSLVEQYVPQHEHEEIKGMLGESLIDQSQELRSEIDTLLDIWRDYRDETNENSRGKLPEPPGLRDRLVQEIQFFLENVKEKSKAHGIELDRVLTTGHNKTVLDYAMESSRPGTALGSRPSTSMSRDGRETPMISTPTGSDRASAASTLSEEIESMNDKLNYLKFDEVVNHLKEYIEEEISTLIKDIQFLHECLDEEATYRAETQGTIFREPTIAELQQERSKMEKEMLSQKIVSQPRVQRQSPMILDKMMQPVAGMKTKNTSPKSGSYPHGSPSSPKGTVTDRNYNNVKTKPMKVSHDIQVTQNMASPGKAPVLDSSKSGLVGMVKVDKSCNVVNIKTESGASQVIVPSPPTSAKSQVRPSSADRFRRMVHQFREDS